MQRSEYGVLLSASDLMRFAGCAHATTLDLAWMRGTGAYAGRGQRGRAAAAAPRRRPRGAPPGAAEGRGPERRRDRQGRRAAGAGRGRHPRGARAGRRGGVPGRARRRKLGRLVGLPRVGRPAVGARALVLRGRRHQAQAQAAPEARPAARALFRPARRDAGDRARAGPRRARRSHAGDDPAGRRLGLCAAGAVAAGDLRGRAGADPAGALRRLPALPLARCVCGAPRRRGQPVPGRETSPAVMRSAPPCPSGSASAPSTSSRARRRRSASSR